MRAEVDKLKAPARRVFELIQDEGKSLRDEDFCPSAVGCNSCPVAPCRYQQKAAETAVIELFAEAETGEQAPKISADDMTPDELGRALELANILEPFFSTVRDKVKGDLNAGKPVSGFKLVSVRAGSKSWKDKTEAKAALQKIFPVKEFGGASFLMKPAELRTPASLLSELKVKRGDAQEVKDIKAARAELLAELITQGTTVCAVAPASDPRPEYKPEPAVSPDDFDFIGDVS